MIENVEQAIRDYLPQIIHMSLGTSRDNKPWVCEVHFAFDQELNLYFRSRTNSRHCLEIKDNPNVAGNIVTQHHGEEKPRGVYFEGICEMAEGTDAVNAINEYNKRFGVDEENVAAKNTDDNHRFYKIVVSKYFVFDTRESKPAQKYELAWK